MRCLFSSEWLFDLIFRSRSPSTDCFFFLLSSCCHKVAKPEHVGAQTGLNWASGSLALVITLFSFWSIANAELPLGQHNSLVLNSRAIPTDRCRSHRVTRCNRNNQHAKEQGVGLLEWENNVVLANTRIQSNCTNAPSQSFWFNKKRKMIATVYGSKPYRSMRVSNQLFSWAFWNPTRTTLSNFALHFLPPRCHIIRWPPRVFFTPWEEHKKQYM